MIILRDEIIQNILEEGEVIAEGYSRKIYTYNNKTYKVANKKHEKQNRKEVELYEANKEGCKFLNKIYAHSRGYEVIEVEYLDCKKLYSTSIKIENESLLGGVYLEELIELEQWIKRCVDFDFKSVNDFIQANKLDEYSIFMPCQWGITQNGKLRLSSYAGFWY